MKNASETDDQTTSGAETAQPHPADTSRPIIDDAWIRTLRADVLEHFRTLGLPALNGQATSENSVLSKETIRASHSYQRRELLQREWAALGHRWPRLLEQFANGAEVQPDSIQPELVPVVADHPTADLFRFATLLWSVPVSHGYGRRMRYLVRDRTNGKLIGVFALGDPVFNLRARDQWIGWSVDDRRARLVNVMDAYVIGAVPPYSQLLGGKLVASLIGSAEVNEDFTARYGHTKGIISGQQKRARLVLVTVTSALGRSSIYNRLKLTIPGDPVQAHRPLVELVRIGNTQGYGHFHLSNSIFDRFRQLLAAEDHPYASGHQFGQGPNWRLRVIRAGLARVGLDEELLRHGIIREVFAMPLSPDFRGFLCGSIDIAEPQRPTVDGIASAALQRWVLPRADRYSQYVDFQREQVLQLIGLDNRAVGGEQLPLGLSESADD